MVIIVQTSKQADIIQKCSHTYATQSQLYTNWKQTIAIGLINEEFYAVTS